ncbi:YALI0F02761p [Yarrowia lipolytica CLIB122]|uniref:YALI0F02761p n=2 Tax=Yarrowia lipolytica TaxID=4952 RepID=Q6C344_YARLI|nr:YALI0F02761p [Yarrowia lipolytica CLIB122]KAB8282130.1 hypothetical protein BKA91DRAFT_138967 [Yarrowia lipolytica]KAE8172011.1 hypothetical protein BKA90DRAFT_138113 [Yarrowia lipolytica]KAJ8056197.1 hypothetical protein LXG23DRAFT_57729 [Yarrowia lipolytica]RMI94920.1 hypothetical protein BD777DRAFT_131001 [Yarrowia lipolytica]CAG77723.1 YALI0F02761p [Yarrowia lipolytica CLIB122]|eukprot:XP_504918.1 YALI0F02761p [Yarrowia lipolytica CLIB122]
MVKKLSFKGDKKTKKPKASSSKGSDKKRPRIDPVEDDQAAGWISAKSSEEFHGPTLLVTTSEGKPCCFVYENSGDAEDKTHSPTMAVSFDLDTVDKSLDTAEPTSTQQVLLLSPLEFDTNKRTIDIDETVARFALKVPSLGVFLGVDKAGVVSLDSVAIGTPQQFTFKREKGDAGVSWTIKTSYDAYIEIKNGKINLTEDGAKASKFTVRLQSSHRKKTTAEKQAVTYYAMSTKALEERAGRSLDPDEVVKLKKSNKEGNLNEALLDLRQKGKSDTYC